MQLTEINSSQTRKKFSALKQNYAEKMKCRKFEMKKRLVTARFHLSFYTEEKKTNATREIKNKI